MDISMKISFRKTLLMTVAAFGMAFSAPSGFAKVENDERPEMPVERYHFGFAGDYLASHFAQSRSDWLAAYGFLDRALDSGKVYQELHKRAMILGMGAGRMDDALEHAEYLVQVDPENRLGHMILAINAMANDKPADAIEYLTKMPDGDISNFVKPLLLGWAYAQKGEYTSDYISETSSFHLYHNALMAHFLGEDDTAKELIGQMLALQDLSGEQLVRAASLLAEMGDKDKALEIFNELQVAAGEDRRVKQALTILKSGAPYENTDSIVHNVHSAKDGAAQAIYDMALVLYQEQSPSSARLFANLALRLNPKMMRVHILLAEALIDSERFKEAREHLLSIPESHHQFLEARRQAAKLLAEADDFKAAQRELKALHKDYGDLSALIDAGHLYRHKEDYESALIIYNKAVKKLGGKVPEDYWYLLYARGMVNEREGHWDDAVKDLTAALEYRPNHPFLLNYLGYGWADKGHELEKALEIIEKAASLQPRDGYIIDSLGWVYYRMGDYTSAIKKLEQAVEYLPYDSTINDHLGDAYWQNNRKLEARFQWERAYNYAEESQTELKEKIRAKLDGHAVPEAPAKKMSNQRKLNP